MSKMHIFSEEYWYTWKDGLSDPDEIRQLDPESDQWLLLASLHHLYGGRQKLMLRRLKLDELPPFPVNTDDEDDDSYFPYLLLREQVEQEYDFDVLKKASYEAPSQMMKCFAFCRLTGYSWSPSECDAYTYCTYSCSPLDGMTPEMTAAYCREMIEKDGSFTEEAEEILNTMRIDHES